MRLHERRRFTVSCLASVLLHVAALGFASWSLAPPVRWQTDVTRGRAALTLVMMPSAPAAEAAVPLVLKETPDARLAEAENALDATDFDPPARPPSHELAKIEVGEPLPDSPQVSRIPRGVRPDAAESLPQRPISEKRQRMKRTLVASPMVAAGMPASPAPAALAAPSGAAFDVPPSQLPENEPPSYPAEARASGKQGRVLLVVRLDTRGRVLQVRVDRTSGHSVLDQAAVDAVSHWRFTPATREGRAVAADILVPVRFSIRKA